MGGLPVRYTELQLSTLRAKSAIDAESRLDIAERILKPRTLADVANAEALHDLQARLLAGEESMTGPKKARRARGPRSAATARNYMLTIMAALHWAEYMEWLPSVPKVRKVKIAKLRQCKGRGLVGEEVDRMLAKVGEVVGSEAEPAWKYLIRGLVESGLRLNELMHVHWSDEQIHRTEVAAGQPCPSCPSRRPCKKMQRKSDSVVARIRALLLETPMIERFGWTFNPMSLQPTVGRLARQQRPLSTWVGEVISRIGCKAGVIVRPAAGNGKPKFASAHDLRRTCAERLMSAGVPEREVSRVLRHASIETTRRHYAPGNVQQAAGVIREALGCTQFSMGTPAFQN